MIHIPVLRGGKPYRSLTTNQLVDLPTGELVGEVSQANPGLIARDLRRAANRAPLDTLTTEELLQACERAADLFSTATLPLGDGEQTADDYVRQVSSTTGLPQVMARGNMEKIRWVLAEMREVLGGLTRGLDLGILDRGYGQQHGRALAYRRETSVLGAVLPSNSPGVHSLWLPAIPLKVGLALKPGRHEPWTPYRIAQAFLQAGIPSDALGFYPTDHAGASEVLLRSGRALLYGDRATVQSWRKDPRVQIHGPGWSKVILGPDREGRWEDDLDLIAASIAENGGRSCVNASGVWAVSEGRALAEAIAERLAAIEAHPLDHPEARLAAFPSRDGALALSEHIDSQLGDGAEDLTAKYRSGDRVVEVGGCTFLLPTVVWCEEPNHPLAAAEYPFPFVTIVQTAADELVGQMGETLVASVLSDDPEFVARFLHTTHVDRLNLGRFPTHIVSWDQPHEGNLFELLYRQRAFQGDAAKETA